MTSYEFGDIVLVEFPFTGRERSKKRPALVVIDVGDADVVLAPITAVERDGPGECGVRDWEHAGLLRPSWVRLAKIACLEKKFILRPLGRVSAGDRKEIADELRSLVALQQATE